MSTSNPADAQPTAARTPQDMTGFLKRYLWLILLCTIIAVGYTVHWTREMEPVYRATSVVEVSPPRTGFTAEDLLGVAPSHREYIETMARRVTMRGVLEPVFETFSLPNQTYEDFRRAIEAEPEEGTNLVTITLDGTSRDRIARVVDATVERFLASVSADHAELTTRTRGILDSEAAELRQQIDGARERLDAFMAKTGLRSSIHEEWDLMHEQLLEKTKLCEASRTDLAPAEALHAEIQRMRAKGEDLSTLPLVVSNTAYADLEEKLNELDRELAGASVEMHANDRAYQSLLQKRKTTASQIASLLKRLVDQALRDYTIRKSSFDRLTSEREDLDRRLREMDRLKFEYDRIQREVERYQTYYEKYLTASGDFDPASDISRAHVRVREAAFVSTKPVRPVWSVNLGLALLAGLLAGILLSLFIDGLRA